MSLDPRELWTLFEPYHAVVYFAPEHRRAQDEVGLKGGWMAYFASRAAPLGAVPAAVVAALFFNFHPAMVARAVPDAWRLARPDDVLAARWRALDAALRRILGRAAEGEEVALAARLAGRVAAAADVTGRPLAAANAALGLPDAPHLALWQAVTVLREHRGDGHVAALVTAGLDGCEAHVTMAASGAVSEATLRPYRGWSDEEWAGAVERLQARGWLDADGRFTDAGRAGRDGVEATTDRLAARPWSCLAQEEIDAFRGAMRAVVARVLDAGEVPFPNPMGVPRPVVA